MKTTPVRWWRDDATRYHGRGAYRSPPYDGPQFEPPPPLGPSLLVAFASFYAALRALGVDR